MQKLFKKILDFDFAKSRASTLDRWSLAALFFLFVFGVYDLLMDTGSGVYHHLTPSLPSKKIHLAATYILHILQQPVIWHLAFWQCISLHSR